MLRQGGELFVLIHDDTALAGLTGVPDATTGISRPFPAGASLIVPRREAEWALAPAGEAGRPVMTYGSDPTQKWLTGDSADLAALAAEVLGSVVRYDTAHGGELVPSVRVWLEHDRDTERAARALHVHPNTLRYRVQRFERSAAVAWPRPRPMPRCGSRCGRLRARRRSRPDSGERTLPAREDVRSSDNESFGIGMLGLLAAAHDVSQGLRRSDKVSGFSGESGLDARHIDAL